MQKAVFGYALIVCDYCKFGFQFFNIDLIVILFGCFKVV